ncbi:hypothetical protein [Bacillus sp. SM2101]|uniref:hypothetical protein n=1 Tax=Bacillus sp. SM2101 TaxID=2805366 RepID=UPI001BDF3F21|nr:hypothetical protein [Bacillus sp. SM2101]
MKEVEWMNQIVANLLRERISHLEPLIKIDVQKKLPYVTEINKYFNHANDNQIEYYNPEKFTADLLIYEEDNEQSWKPRIIIEGKVFKTTSHDAITYSQKAASHKNVHPYLRYGILIGNREHYALPGRLFRHGSEFDFMSSWVSYEPNEPEINALVKIILDEIKVSRNIEEVLYNSRSSNREKYTSYHRKMVFSKSLESADN